MRLPVTESLIIKGFHKIVLFTSQENSSLLLYTKLKTGTNSSIFIRVTVQIQTQLPATVALKKIKKTYISLFPNQSEQFS